MSRSARRRRRRGGVATVSFGGSVDRYVTAPAAVSQVAVTPAPPIVRVSGTDYLELEAVPTDVSDGAVLIDFLISPEKMVGTHARAVASGYERYRFDQLEVILSSRAPTSCGGGYILGSTADVHTMLAPGISAKRFSRALEGSVSAPWWSPAVMRCDTRDDEPWYYFSTRADEPYKTTQQRLFMVVDGSPTGITGSISVSVQLRWSMRLADPTIHPTGVALDSWTVEPFNISAGSPRYWYVGTATKFWAESQYGVVYGVEARDGTPLVVKDEAGVETPIVALQVGKTKPGSEVLILFSKLTDAFAYDASLDLTNTKAIWVAESKIDSSAVVIRTLGIVPPKRSGLLTGPRRSLAESWEVVTEGGPDSGNE